MRRTLLLMGVLTLPFASLAQELGPLISGTQAHVDGTFVWTDYAYDDRGANSDPTLPGGDDDYAPGEENRADLIQLQIDRVGGELRVLALLETLLDAGDPLLGVAFDSDANPATGAIALPGSAWSPLGPLGVDLLLSVSSSGASVQSFDGLQWVEIGTAPATVDVVNNTMETSLPAALIDPENQTWRAFGVLGLASDSWLQGGPIFDLAFVRAETVVDTGLLAADSVQAAASGDSIIWQDHRQADVLAGLLDASEAAASIDFARVAAGDTELPSADTPGFHSFLYHSALELGEGIQDFQADEIPSKLYGGPYQPYLVYLPPDLPPAPRPLVMFLHGIGQNHLQNTFFFDASGAASPDQEIFEYPAAVILTLGRVLHLASSGVSEQDALDAMADAIPRLGIDPERVVLAGLSNGAVGTYRLTSLYPDRFAAGISHVGSAGRDPIPELMENQLNIPFRAENGGVDPIVSAGLYLPDRTRGLELGYDYRFFVVANGHHEPHQALINCIYREALQTPRVVNPPRVHYAVVPADFAIEPSSGLDLRYAGAYWVSDMVVRAGQAKGVVDATSLARADRSTVATVVDTVQDNSVSGRDYCGPAPEVLTNEAWQEQSVLHAPGPPQPVSNAMQVALSALDSLSLDLERMSLSVAAPLQVESSGDGPSDLRLVGNWPGSVDVERDGQPFGQIVPAGGAIVLSDDMTGEHVYVLSSRDFDGDGVNNDIDNCPLASNPLQEDSGGLNTASADGIGNACQCGDVTGNGIVNGQDSNAIRRHGLGLESNPIFRMPGNCDVTGNDACNGQDGNSVRAAALGSASPLFGQNCHNATGAALPQGF